MEFINIKGSRYQILARPPESSYDFYVRIARKHDDFVVLRNNVDFMFCRKVDEAALITPDGYLYSSC